MPDGRAELTRQVVTVLGRVEDRLVTGLLADPSAGSGQRTGRLVDQTVAETFGPFPSSTTATPFGPDQGDGARDLGPGGADGVCIADAVIAELARDLPGPLRSVARHRPRWALACHDRLDRDHARALDLVRLTHRRLGGVPRHPSARGRRPAV